MVRKNVPDGLHALLIYLELVLKRTVQDLVFYQKLGLHYERNIEMRMNDEYREMVLTRLEEDVENSEVLRNYGSLKTFDLMRKYV